jgi:hypothetical protein
MRKVALTIAAAIKAGQSAHVDNTTYCHEDGTVTLHGNRILYRDGNAFRIDLQTCLTWPTRTTCSRVNDLVNAVTGYGDGTRLRRLHYQLMVDLGRDGIADATKLTRDPVAFTL